MRNISFANAILEGTDQLMQNDPSVYLMGLGVPDPKGIFGTTLGLQEKYGPTRVMDMPTAENACTGIAIGSAILGMRPIMTHQRVDFFILALDQLINNAAKWHYMFGGQMSVPLVIRLIIGRGWGQGPQHSQTLTSLFANIPGLKVVAPSTPYDAKGLLASSVKDNNPVIYLEHRWLHNVFGNVPEELYEIPIGKAHIIQEGSDLTLITYSHMTLEARRAAEILKQEGVFVEVIDLRTIKPLDRKTIVSSVKKTGKVVIADSDWKSSGFAAEVMATICEEAFDSLTLPPKRITCPDKSCPTSWPLSNHFYPTYREIVVTILQMLKKETKCRALIQSLLEVNQIPLDVPDKAFTGPF